MAGVTAPPLEVHSYDLNALVRLIAQLSPFNSETAIRAKAHTTYIDGYLRHLGVKTVLVERSYVDRDYLEDFAAYYVKCFEKYERTCARLHFFNQSFTEAEFRRHLLQPGSHSRLQNSYCGFIVIKPLPRTVFGRTCLATYSQDEGRSFPVARSFTAHLFGIELEIKSTLPFQEQDTVVAACATSALWSVLQATAREFHHGMMTPIDITKAATYLLPASTRMIPNREGLSSPMMAEAIRSVGLEPLMLEAPPNDDATLKAALYAYLHARIPVIMGVSLVEQTKQSLRVIGDHAIAIAGYKLDSKSSLPSKASLRLRSSRIQKIYVHDDQVGPFARMEFDGKLVRPTKKTTLSSLSTSYGNGDGLAEKVRAIPLILLVPHYHKIRIHYEDVISAVADFHGFLASIHLPNSVSAKKFEWDVYLTTVNEFKKSISSERLESDRKLKWMTHPMPKFLWRATAHHRATAVMDVIIDATDIQTSNAVHAVIVYDKDLNRFLTSIASSPDLAKVPDILPGARRVLSALETPRSQ